MTFAICLANRGTFPGSLFDTARKDLTKALSAQGHKALLLPAGSTRHDAVQVRAHRRDRVSASWRERRDA